MPLKSPLHLPGPVPEIPPVIDRPGTSGKQEGRNFPDSGVSGTSGKGSSYRWMIVIALLISPDVEGRRLAALLTGWKCETRRHLVIDDCQRRPGAGKAASASGFDVQCS